MTPRLIRIHAVPYNGDDTSLRLSMQYHTMVTTLHWVVPGMFLIILDILIVSDPACDGSWPDKFFAIRRSASSMSIAYRSCSEELANIDCRVHREFFLRWFKWFCTCSCSDSSTWSPTAQGGGLQQSNWSPTSRIDCSRRGKCSSTAQTCGLW